MFSTKQIAAVSGLLGGLVVTCTSGAHAHAAGACTTDSQGSTHCVQRMVETPEGERYFVRQDGCTPVQPLTLPSIPLVSSGRMRVGPEVTCSPNTNQSSPGTQSSPDKSANTFELPGGLLG